MGIAHGAYTKSPGAGRLSREIIPLSIVAGDGGSKRISFFRNFHDDIAALEGVALRAIRHQVKQMPALPTAALTFPITAYFMRD